MSRLFTHAQALCVCEPACTVRPGVGVRRWGYGPRSSDKKKLILAGKLTEKAGLCWTLAEPFVLHVFDQGKPNENTPKAWLLGQGRRVKRRTCSLEMRNWATWASGGATFRSSQAKKPKRRWTKRSKLQSSQCFDFVWHRSCPYLTALRLRVNLNRPFLFEVCLRVRDPLSAQNGD